MSADSHFDLVVIGGGSGGLAGAFRAAALGARVALLEPSDLGGTCVNVGCVPKKAMWLAADMAQRLSMARQLGFDLPDAAPLDWREFIVHRQRYIAGIHASYRKRLDDSGVVWMPCRGQLQDARTVRTSTGAVLRAGRVLIATGGRPRRPALPGAELGLVSDDFFQFGAAPAKVAIIGAGYVAVELAGVLQALGSQVDMYIRGSRLLEGFDHELTDDLLEDQRQHGIRAHFGWSVAEVRAEGGARVLINTARERSEPFDHVLFATGRVPSTADLGLENAGVRIDDKGFVCVDEWQDTNVPNIHAVGDVTAAPALTPVAIAAARRLMDRVYGGKQDARVEHRGIATVVFSHPPIGKVGLTEEEARELHGDAVKVFRTRFRPMLHALADSPQRSLFKLVCVGAEERVVGLHLMGEGADEILQGFAVAVRKGITRRHLEDTMAIHPTSAEEVVLLR